jgi:GNAT superfamily N-acetyltransferase
MPAEGACGEPREFQVALGTISARVSVMEVVYRLESYPQLGAAEFIDLLERSTLAERRPVDEPETIEGMLKNADIIVTARSGGRLIGVSRAITDFSFCTYLSDLAVDERFQRQGIGKELIRRTHDAAGLTTTLILLAAPKARTYYPRVGMASHDSCWIIPRTPAEDS